jgi:hypothetical protein
LKGIMLRLLSLFITVFSVAAELQPAIAGTIASSFGPGNAYDLNGGLSISTAASANNFETATATSFTPSATSGLAQIDIALGWVSGTNAFVVTLRNDNGGPTGSVIEAWTFAAPIFGNPDLSTLTPTGAIILNGGTTYWIVALPGGSDTWGAWNHPLPDTSIGGLATSHDGGNTWFPPVVAPGVPAYDVLSTPETSCFLLTCIGLAAVTIRRLPSLRRS